MKYHVGDIEQQGLDAGGLFRDWIGRVSKEIFTGFHGLIGSTMVDDVPFFWYDTLRGVSGSAHTNKLTCHTFPTNYDVFVTAV